MQKGIIPTILGTLGIVQYLYYQLCTTSTLEYTLKEVPYQVGSETITMLEPIISRNWTMGIVTPIIGLIALVVGLCLIKEAHDNKSKEMTNASQ